MLASQIGLWLNELKLDDVPRKLLEAERLKHKYIARNCRKFIDLEKLKVGSASESAIEQRLNSIGSSGLFPRHIGGVVGPVSILRCWSIAETAEFADKNPDELILATLAGAEVASRIGAALLLEDPLTRQSFMTSAATACAESKFRGLSAVQSAHALSLALETSPRLSSRTFRSFPEHFFIAALNSAQKAVDAAINGEHGDPKIFEATDGIFSKQNALRGPWLEDYNNWFSSPRVLPNSPGSLRALPAVQALNEILDRHLKAADKRLRWDQIKDIEIKLPKLADKSMLPQIIASWVLNHDWSKEVVQSEWIKAQRDKIHHVASKVRLIECPELTLSVWADHIGSMSPLFSGFRTKELICLLGNASGIEGIIGKLKYRYRFTQNIRRFDSLRLDEMQFCAPSFVRLQTTRGGLWPNQVEIPWGSPAWSQNEIAEFVDEKQGLKNFDTAREWLDSILRNFST